MLTTVNDDVEVVATLAAVGTVSPFNKTVGKYITYLCRAFAFYRIRRYDIKGKKYLQFEDKYKLSMQPNGCSRKTNLCLFCFTNFELLLDVYHYE